MTHSPNRCLAGLLASSAMACIIVPAAHTQEDLQDETAIDLLDEDAAEEEAAVQDKIVVTGSLLRRTEFTSASPIQVLTAEVATLEGLISAADILQGSSIAAGSTQLNNQFGGFVINGGTGINTVSLRGLGDQRTLVLLNGRRPGPAGVRGAVGAFDLNVIPDSAVTRYEILKDGASTIYGSDAVGGVVNIITRTAVDQPELTVRANVPFESGGESLAIDGAFGLNFDRGNIAISGQYTLREDLSIGDRDYLACGPDLIKGVGGGLIDREDRSINAGTSNDNCDNIYANTFIEGFNFANRYIPSPDGVSEGPIPGYRLRTNASYATSEDGQAFFEDDLYDPRVNSADARNRQEIWSLFATSDFAFDVLGGVNWLGEFLYTQRKSESEGWRQFFPYIGGDDTGAPYSTEYENGFGFLAVPITAFPSNRDVTVDYLSIASTLEGSFGQIEALKDWVWTFDLSHTKSDGEETINAILSDRSGDWFETDNAPTYDPADPAWLDGSDTSWYDQVQSIETGTTVYEQTIAQARVSGPVYELPAGEILAAIGMEGRKYSIDDQPSENSVNANIWGSSAALPTVGEEDVFEVFGEVEIPLLKGAPSAEELSLNLSARAFNYATYGTGDVWKIQGNWQVTPEVRFRATKGTTFRAPALFETFLGATTGFQSQLAIDPCANWGESSNQNLRTNCASIGIPEDYSPIGSSATIFSEGGGSDLTPETAESETLGVIFTPSFINLSLAIDYFNIEVEDQIAQLDAATVVSGCYIADNFPDNSFCDLLERNDANATEPFAITSVRDIYVNVNSQKTDGVDITLRYDQEFEFGDVIFEGQATYTDTDIIQLFDTAEETGFDVNDFNGTIGDPEWVWNSRLSLDRGDFRYSWFMDYIGVTDSSVFADSEITYQGVSGIADRKAEEVVYHDASVRWTGDSLQITVGVENIFDEAPPTISSGLQRRGTVPLSAGYPLRGRTGFVQLTKVF
ncbi:MAG: TonB-dependent receptor [Pseudomonadota bacterium]